MFSIIGISATGQEALEMRVRNTLSRFARSMDPNNGKILIKGEETDIKFIVMMANGDVYAFNEINTKSNCIDFKHIFIDEDGAVKVAMDGIAIHVYKVPNNMMEIIRIWNTCASSISDIIIGYHAFN